MLPLATPLACSRMAEVVAEVAAVVDELVAAVSNGQQHSSAEVNDDSSSPTEDEDSDNAEADALVAGAVECEPEDEWTASSQQGCGLGSSDEQMAGMLARRAVSAAETQSAMKPASSGQQAASDEAASNEDGAAAGATAKTPQPTEEPGRVVPAVPRPRCRASA